MFTVTEFRLIQKNCPEKLDALLNNLGIKTPDLNSGDEFKIFAALDEKIISSLCQKMESGSILEGYTKLMTLGGLHFNYSETENELLAMILQNKDKIQNCLQNKNIETEKNASPPTVDEEIFDYTNVDIVFSRADFSQNIIGTLELRNRKILSDLPKNLKNQIRNLICDYWRKNKRYNVIDAIEISMEIRDEIPKYNKKNPKPLKVSDKPAQLSFDSDKISDVMETLKLVEDIVKSMD